MLQQALGVVSVSPILHNWHLLSITHRIRSFGNLKLDVIFYLVFVSIVPLVYCIEVHWRHQLKCLKHVSAVVYCHVAVLLNWSDTLTVCSQFIDVSVLDGGWSERPEQMARAKRYRWRWLSCRENLLIPAVSCVSLMNQLSSNPRQRRRQSFRPGWADICFEIFFICPPWISDCPPCHK